MRPAPPPVNISQLDARLQDVAHELKIPVARARQMLCTLIVSQMLPEAVTVKGGMGVKLRMGESGTRATADLDVSTRARGEEFEQPFTARLATGWGTVPASRGALRRDPDAPDRIAFTAALRRGRIHDPGLARPHYAIHPYRVSLSFLGKLWGGLDVEVSDPEIDPRAHSRREVDRELVQMGQAFGFGELRPVELIDLEHQIAQKIHAVTDPSYVRAHDLVDLQLLWAATPDLPALHRYCTQTFEWRHAQKWPPLPLRSMDSWTIAYSEARQETKIEEQTPVLPDISSARGWLEQKIQAIHAA